MRLLLSLFALVAMASAMRCYTHPDVISVRNQRVLNFPEAISECKADAICGVVKLSTTSRRMCTPNCPVRNGCKGSLCCCDTDLCNKDIEAMRRERREVPEYPTNSTLKQARGFDNVTSVNASESSEAARFFKKIEAAEGSFEFSMNKTAALEAVENAYEAPSNSTNLYGSLPIVFNAAEAVGTSPTLEKAVEAFEAPSNASNLYGSLPIVFNAVEAVESTPAVGKAVEALEKVAEAFEAPSNDSEAIEAFSAPVGLTKFSEEIASALRDPKIRKTANSTEAHAEAQPHTLPLTNQNTDTNTVPESTPKPVEDAIATTEAKPEVAPEVLTKASTVEVLREPWMKESNVSSVELLAPKGEALITGDLSTVATDPVRSTLKIVEHKPRKSKTVKAPKHSRAPRTKATTAKHVPAITTTPKVDVKPSEASVAKVFNSSNSEAPKTVVDVLEVAEGVTASKNNETIYEAAPKTTEVVTTTTEDPIYVLNGTKILGAIKHLFHHHGKNETDAELKAGDGPEPSAAMGSGGVALLFAALLTLTLE